MVYEIEDIEDMPLGFSEAASPAGEYFPVSLTGFITPLNHSDFYDRLESFREYLPDGITPGSVNVMLGVFRRDRSASIYTNKDITLSIGCRASNSIEKGQIIRDRDIADIKNLNINIAIPNDCGFFFIFHVGWIRCCFYDYCPLAPNELLQQNKIPGERNYDISKTLGDCYRSVFFRKILNHSDSEWDLMFEKGWFPFFGLDTRHLTLLKDFWGEGYKTDEIVEDIAEDLKKRLPELLESWRKYKSFVDFHDNDLSQAIKYFLADDHIGCGYILHSKIEGIMRSDYMTSKYREGVLGGG